MPEQATLDAPDFDLIQKQAGLAAAVGMRTLWGALNNEMRQRRIGVRLAKEQRVGKITTVSWGSSQNNFDFEGAMILLSTGSSNVDLTGLSKGQEGQILFILNVGSGTITVKNNSASSSAAHRFRTQSGADLSLTTDKTVIVQYANSLWRETKLV